MPQKVDATKWTGLAPDRAVRDVRDAHKPVAEPQALEPRSYYRRIIDWSDLLIIGPIAFLIAAVLGADLGEILKLSVILLMVIHLPSLVKWIARRLQGNPPAVAMDEQGLHFPYAFRKPIPWSKVGEISYTYGPKFGWVSVALDQSHRAERKYPWPFDKFGLDASDVRPGLEIISTWETRAKGDELIATLEKFRDNYCAA
ncbi:MAG: hypothetical protein AAF687_10130 [Pseudomonadota bacterium]